MVTADISNAFLCAPLRDDESLWIVVPEGLGLEGEGQIARVRKAWYGLLSSAKNWGRHLEEALHDDGWRQNVKERCLWKKRE